MVTLKGKSQLTIETTKAEMEFIIMSRTSFEDSTPEDVSNFEKFVEKAVNLVCHAAPEYIVPAQMCRDALALGAMIGTMSIDGKITLEEVIEGGDEPHGNA
jgi:hypothetical protein